MTIDPRATVAPVFDAEPEEVVVTPSTCALVGGFEEGAGTTISIPDRDWPAAKVIVIGEFTGLVVGTGGPIFLFDDFPPQPTMAKTAKRQIE